MWRIQARPTLLGIPPEIRSQIYGYLTDNIGTIKICGPPHPTVQHATICNFENSFHRFTYTSKYGTFKCFSGADVALAATCATIRNEMQPLLPDTYTIVCCAKGTHLLTTHHLQRYILSKVKKLKILLSCSIRTMYMEDHTLSKLPHLLHVINRKLSLLHTIEFQMQNDRMMQLHEKPDLRYVGQEIVCPIVVKVGPSATIMAIRREILRLLPPQAEDFVMSRARSHRLEMLLDTQAQVFGEPKLVYTMVSRVPQKKCRFGL